MKDWLWYRMYDAKIAIARFLLDHTSIGNAVVHEAAFRRLCDRARELGADVYCVFHDCDAHDCPEDHWS